MAAAKPPVFMWGGVPASSAFQVPEPLLMVGQRSGGLSLPLTLMILASPSSILQRPSRYGSVLAGVCISKVFSKASIPEGWAGTVKTLLVGRECY